MTSVGWAASAAIAVLMLSGCARADVAAAPVPGVTPLPTFITPPMPDLGPVPERPVYTEAEQTAEREAQAERAWAAVLAQFPDAVRPEVAFERYVDGDEVVESRVPCLAEYGVEATLVASGGAYETSAEGPDGAERVRVASFACDTRLPTRPGPPLTVAELSYLYDYLTGFLAPCYEANGVAQTAPPSREDFIANWPNQGWYPSANMSGDPEIVEAENAACPPSPPAWK